MLDAAKVDWRVRLDLVRGALDAHWTAPRSRLTAVGAPLVAGGAWTLAAVATVGEPAPPDWPGYLATTLPLALVGVLAGFVSSIAVATRMGDLGGRGGRWAVRLAIVGQGLWVVALAIAILGGPYGAVTGAAASLAAIGLIALGAVGIGAADAATRWSALVLLILGGAFLIPSPVAWFLVGIAWTALGLVGSLAAEVPSTPPGARS